MQLANDVGASWKGQRKDRGRPRRARAGKEVRGRGLSPKPCFLKAIHEQRVNIDGGRISSYVHFLHVGAFVTISPVIVNNNGQLARSSTDLHHGFVIKPSDVKYKL